MPRVLLVLLVLAVAGCAGEPQSWAALKKQLPGMESEQRDAAVEKFIAAMGGTPIVENQTRLVFLARDVNGVTPRVVGDFNAWAATPQGYDAAIGKMTRIDGTTWSYSKARRTNARAEYVLFVETVAAADPMNPRKCRRPPAPLGGSHAVLGREP